MLALGQAAASARTHKVAKTANPYGGWSVTDKISPLDDTPNFVASILADNTVFGTKGAPKRPALLISCDHSGFFVEVNWTDRMANPKDAYGNATWKLDNGAVQNTLWYLDTKSIFQAGALAQATAVQWSAGEVLVLRAPDRHDGQDAIFHLNGMDKVMQRVGQLKCDEARSGPILPPLLSLPNPPVPLATDPPRH